MTNTTVQEKTASQFPQPAVAKDMAASIAIPPTPLKREPQKAKLQVPDFVQAEYARTMYQVRLRFGQTREDLLRPDFFAHVASRIKQNDRIEVLHEEGNYFAELIVVSAEKLGIKIAFLREVKFDALETSAVESDDYFVQLRGPRKWSIIRKSDRVVVEENIQTQGQALAKLRDMVGGE